MAGQIIAIIDTEGNATIASYCLKTDSWNDFLAFKIDAEEAVKREDYRSANRFLRAGLICLFSHVESVVNEIECSRSLSTNKRLNKKRPSLNEKIEDITHEANEQNKISPMNFILGKHLRDIIAHPGIKKNFQGGKREEELNVASVFEKLDLATLQDIDTEISRWIEAVCKIFTVSRFTDTEQEVLDLAKALGNTTMIREV